MPNEILAGRKKGEMLTSRVETTRERLASESETLVVLPFWLSVMFRPLGGSQVPIWRAKHQSTVSNQSGFVSPPSIHTINI